MRHAGPAPEGYITIPLHPWASECLLSYSLNVAKNFEVSSFLPCLFYSHALCTVLSFVLYSSFLEGTRSWTSQNISLSPAPNSSFALARGHYSSVVLAAGGCWCHTLHQEVKRSVRSVFSSSLCCLQTITLPGKNPVIFPSYLLSCSLPSLHHSHVYRIWHLV